MGRTHKRVSDLNPVGVKQPPAGEVPQRFVEMRRRHCEAAFAATQAAEAAISNPLLDDVCMKGASGLLVSITGGNDLTLYEVDEAASRDVVSLAVAAPVVLALALRRLLDAATRRGAAHALAGGLAGAVDHRGAAQHEARASHRGGIEGHGDRPADRVGGQLAALVEERHKATP